jgi:hypothetical protein
MRARRAFAGKSAPNAFEVGSKLTHHIVTKVIKLDRAMMAHGRTRACEDVRHPR